MAIALLKVNALVYVGVIAILCIAIWKKPRGGIALMGAGILSAGLNYLPAILQHVPLMESLSRAQAVSTGIIVPLSLKIFLVSMGWLRFVGGERETLLLGGCFITMAILILLRDKPTQRVNYTLLLLMIGFSFAFLVSSLYYLTYIQIFIYSFAFVGLASIPAARLLERYFTRMKKISPASEKVIQGSIFILLIVLNGLTLSTLTNGAPSSLGTQGVYEGIIANVPNDASTKLLYMNNINPLTLGLEKTRIVDHTLYPKMEGDPCDFWKKNGITHIVYFSFQNASYQLDGGNRKFYEDAQKELMEEKCTDTLAFIEDKNTIISKMRN
jgi:hypothetical protein